MSNVIFKAYDLPAYSLDAADHILSRQENGEMGYIKAGQFATTGSNIFEGGQIIDGNITVTGDIYAANFVTSSTLLFTGSTNHGSHIEDTHTYTGSVSITGSLNVIGGINGVINATNGVVSSSAQITSFGFVSGSYETTGRGIVSGSISYVNLTNIPSNIVSSSIQIKNYGDFATTGSNTFNGNQTITGSFLVSGSTTQIGNNTLSGNTIMSGTLDVSGSTTFRGVHQLSGSNSILGNTIMSGSVGISGSTFIEGNTTIKGMLFVSGSTNFSNHTITMTGSMFTSGSQVITGSLDINGNVNVASGSEFYLAGNKLFNYGQFSDTTTQSGSANTAYSMKLNTTDVEHHISIVSGSRITVANTGLYNLQFSAQLDNSANTNELVDIWFAITGSNVANSNTQLAINKAQAGNFGKSVAAWNILLPLSASNYVEIKWSATNSTITLSSFGTQSNPNRPAVPSVIATMTQVA